jgi:hypothetical protein
MLLLKLASHFSVHPYLLLKDELQQEALMGIHHYFFDQAISVGWLTGHGAGETEQASW